MSSFQNIIKYYKLKGFSYYNNKVLVENKILTKMKYLVILAVLIICSLQMIVNFSRLKI